VSCFPVGAKLSFLFVSQADAEDKHHVARMYDYFICKGHVCIVFELLSVNLYELLKSNAYRCVAPWRLLYNS
jgi:hypothetical protein